MSQISADTIKGVTSANNLTLGNTPIVSASANSLTIRGEGSAQTSVQQGLLKAWARINQTGSVAIVDSFGWSSLTDNGTADLTSTFAVTMGNTTYAPSQMMNDANYGGVIQGEYGATNTTTTMRTRTCANWHDANPTYDTNGIYFQIAGDLA